MFYLQINMDGFIDLASLYVQMHFGLDGNFYSGTTLIWCVCVTAGRGGGVISSLFLLSLTGSGCRGNVNMWWGRAAYQPWLPINICSPHPPTPPSVVHLTRKKSSDWSDLLTIIFTEQIEYSYKQHFYYGHV